MRIITNNVTAVASLFQVQTDKKIILPNAAKHNLRSLEIVACIACIIGVR
ncbi:hypothetical protein X777_10453 [Ooceraea biroi]|uniref:Uncharacterized protein n=1 Tax=Ooceraea biroi TaxID=2015173 RepID=A0A026W404_OOCBI|nr:hypothetical protein X777_10453 [Ooceraea biroi]